MKFIKVKFSVDSTDKPVNEVIRNGISDGIRGAADAVDHPGNIVKGARKLISRPLRWASDVVEPDGRRKKRRS